MQVDANRAIITRLLPKTRQITTYIGYDDGYYQKGWWKGTKHDNNRSRFLLKSIAGDEITIDHATGLLWPTNFNADGGNGGDSLTWAEIFAWALALDFAGFIDWRIPNIRELASIVDYACSNPALNASHFSNTNTKIIASSTTNAGNSGEFWYLNSQTGVIELDTKIDQYEVIAVRSL